MNINAYEILELKPYELNKLNVKKAYLKKLRQFPPEQNPDKFKKIRQAYDILVNANSPYEKLSVAPIEIEKIKKSKLELQVYLENKLKILDKLIQIKKSFILNELNNGSTYDTWN